MASSTEKRSWAERAGRVLPGGVLSRYVLPKKLTIVSQRGSGARLYDTEGREFIDYTMGGGSVLLGHGSPVVNEAIKAQIESGLQFFSIVNDKAIELAEMLVEVLPCAEQVRFTISGSEAVAGALRIARTATGRRLVLKFEGAYHGNHDTQLLSVGKVSGGPDYKPLPDSLGIPPGALQDIVMAPFNDLETTTEIISRHASELAAIIVEPVQRFLAPEPGFLEGLRKLADKTGAALVFDEIVTGFRIDYRGAQGKYGVVPDIAVFGKALGGGMPIAAICGKKDTMRFADPTRAGGQFAVQTGTLNGNPLGCAVGIAILQHLGDGKTFEHLDALGSRMRDGLDRLFAEAGVAAHAYGVGSFWHVLFHKEKARTVQGTLDADRSKLFAFQESLLERGIYVVPGVRSFISAAHTQGDIDHTLEVAREVLKQKAAFQR